MRLRASEFVLMILHTALRLVQYGCQRLQCAHMTARGPVCPGGLACSRQPNSRQCVAGPVLALLLLAVSPASAAQMQPKALLGGSAAGYATVSAPRTFEFPADHGSHDQFRSEWWYATGHLQTTAARIFGFQLTLFRFRLRPPQSSSAQVSPSAPELAPRSAWRSEHIWMGHMAVTDVATGKFYAFERFARGGALGLAGARSAPLRVWVEDWHISANGAAANWPWKLQARDGDVELSIELRSGRAPLAQGRNGYSQKSAGADNASYYYSMTRMLGDGHIRIGEQSYRGAATVWLDREWSSSALGAQQLGWDWFGLHLADGRDLMLYRLRRVDGSVDRFSAATVVNADGTVTKFSAEHFDARPQGLVQMPSGRRYPLAWHLTIPDAAIDLHVSTPVANQEHLGLLPYWEGSVELRNARGEAAGRGYLEMTGYDSGAQP